MCDEDLLASCNRFQIPYNSVANTNAYTLFPSIIQSGPQCGIIALAMYCKLTTKQQIQQLEQVAKSAQFTRNGEIFSAQDLCTLTKLYTNNKRVELYSGYLANENIKVFLLNRGVMLVPYDSDANHSPCCKNGHKAHWALISGVIMWQNRSYVIARHGKSKWLGIWPLNELAASNAQLNEFSPERNQNDYVLPDGGISGPNGLRNKAILIYNT